MQEKYLIIGVIIFIVVCIFIAIVFITIRNNNLVVETKVVKTPHEDTPQFTIKDMNEIAASRKSTREDLQKAVDMVISDFPFPKKVKYKLPKGIKVYLNFILLVASHKNADAKLIAYMDENLKEKNPQYITEIDIYENQGLKERSNRI
ncbi:hypothetical protein [Sulfurospirillum sp. 1612]|uniref:hypothetical protein n=1 Tax=Sulfurospirillum sp. 1612 TaxID=3094835 RepID=UPI002F92D2BC